MVGGQQSVHDMYQVHPEPAHQPDARGPVAGGIFEFADRKMAAHALPFLCFPAVAPLCLTLLHV